MPRCDEVCRLGDMSCVITDSLNIFRTKKQVNEPDGLGGIDTQPTDQLLENLRIECIDLLVLLAHDQRLISVTRDERVQSTLEVLRRETGKTIEPFYNVLWKMTTRYGCGALGDLRLSEKWRALPLNPLPMAGAAQ